MPQEIEYVKHPTLRAAQRAIMAEVEYVQRTKSNELGYSVLLERAVIASVRPAMVRHGVTLRPISSAFHKVGEYITQKGARMGHIVGTKTFLFEHVDSDDKAEVSIFAEAADSSDKCSSKIETMTRKLAIRTWLSLEIGDDETEVVEQRGADNGGKFRRAVSALKTTRSAQEAAEKLAVIIGHKASNWTAAQVDALDDLAAEHVQWLADTSSATAKRQASELK